jgi:ABC-type thiamin/hydroxymethylpyrimidine transport system permease subunit
MKTTALVLALQIAGVLHLGLMCAGLLMPRVVQMRSHLTALPVFIRQLFWVYYSFIALCLAGFCVITIAFADTLAAGGNLARAMCAFLAVFWTLRLVAATFVFDMRPYLTDQWRRLGYHAINIVFIYLPVVYAWAAWKGGKP